MGYNFSMINYDTIAGGVPGSMNLFWNQAAMHSSVYPSLFMAPNMGCFNFSPYMNNTNNNWLLDPGFALTNAFNKFGMTCPWTMNGGFTPGDTTSSAKTEEEIEAEEKRKELNKIISELISAKVITDAEKKKIDNAKKEAKDAGEDLVGQYEAYKAKFDEVISEKGDKVKQEILEKGDKLKLEDGTTMMEARQKVGLGDLSITGSSFDAENVSTRVNSDNVIEFIEAYQEQENTKIIEGLSNTDNYAYAAKNLNAVANALLTKAKSLRSKLNSSSKITLNNAISNLERKKVTDNDSGITIPDKFNEDFEKLYVLTRIIIATDLEDEGYTVDNTNITVESVSNDDNIEKTEEEKQAEKALDQNGRALEKALRGTNGLYNSTTVNVTNSNGETITLTKLEPDTNKLACGTELSTYYLNLETGTVTKADTSGDYNPANTSSFDDIKDDCATAASTCLKALVDNNETYNEISNSFSLEETYGFIDGGDNRVIKLVEDDEDGSQLKSKITESLDSIINEICQEAERSYIDSNILNIVKNKMISEYNALDFEAEKEGTGMGTTKNVSARNGAYYKYLNEDEHDDYDPKVKGYEWDHESGASGVTIIYDNDSTVSWHVRIDTRPIVQRFEYLVAEEIKKRNGLNS